MRRIVGISTVVGRDRPGNDRARVVAAHPAAVQCRLQPVSIGAFDAPHESCAEVADLAAAVRAVVEIGVVGAPAVLHEGGKKSLGCPELPLLCPADAEIVARRRDIGAGLCTHRTLTHRRPELIAALFLLLRPTALLRRRGNPRRRQ